ncbi:MAG: Eco57I restriction-modification methylase domain-containing protein [Rhodanobacteraceae bacterium]
MTSLDLFAEAPRTPEIEAAVMRMAGEDEGARGAVFTRPEIVEAILDLSGYRVERPLHRMHLLEPSFGGGEFLLSAVDRLLQACEREEGSLEHAMPVLEPAIRGIELHAETFRKVRTELVSKLERRGINASDAQALCDVWLLCDDFLLTPLDAGFDFVVGNPPYVRQERIPSALVREYRRRFSTLYDRADLYVPFFERSLDLLAADGTLGFICANRWLKNRYGGPLREKISSGFWLKYFLDTEDVAAFHADVMAYPAITVIQKLSEARPPSLTLNLVHASALGDRPLADLVCALLSDGQASSGVHRIELTDTGSEPLLLDDIARLALVQRIEKSFPTLEEVGCKVGIGVATGCDKVYIGKFEELPVEAERKLPLVMARDLAKGVIQWSGKGVVNPFDESGRLVDLDDYPLLRSYMEGHEESIRKRSVARRNPHGWFRTIDRIQPRLQETPKLLVPDIKGESVFVLDAGQFYPHHNLYYVVSETWDLRALQAVLLSSVTLVTVATYCTRMAGGFLRFQAQYLRRIRIPAWQQIDSAMRERLVAASLSHSQEEIDGPVFALYGLSEREAANVEAMARAARVSLRPRS